MSLFSEALFEEKCNLIDADQTVESTIRLAAQTPESLYLFFQRYTHFNGYVSAVISRLASTIAMSRYLFTDPSIAVVEEADKGFQLSTEIMVAAADEGAHGITHRELAQITLKTVGDYAGFSTTQRNAVAQIPDWLEQIIDGILAGYPGEHNDVESLVKAVGFHAASELLGDREYAILDKVIRYDNKGTGFDRYLREEAAPAKVNGHRYDPWCYVLIHGKHEGSGEEAKHFEHVLNALHMLTDYLPESDEQIMDWALSGFSDFVALQQRLFREIYRESLELAQQATESKLTAV